MPDRQTAALIHRIERSLIEALSDHAGARLLVAVSGGADSSASLLALHDRAVKHGWQLEAAHFDHGIASTAVRESFRLAACALVEKVGVPLHLGAADVPSQAAGSGLEATARDVRYVFLARTARDCGSHAVVVAHTMDDQAETVLLHLIRGSGLDGLAGMSPSGPIPGAADVAMETPPLLRPLLGLRRAETEALCRAFQVAWVDDPANRDPVHQRTQIRHMLIPALAELNPRIVEALAGLADGAAADRAALDRVAAEALEAARRGETSRGLELVLSRRALRAEPVAVRTRVLRLAVERVGGGAISRERTAALERLLERGGGLVECSGGVITTARGDLLTVMRSTDV